MQTSYVELQPGRHGWITDLYERKAIEKKPIEKKPIERKQIYEKVICLFKTV